MSQVQVRDKDNRGISFINIRLSLEGQNVDEAYDDRFTDLSGNTAWPNPIHASSYTLFVNQRNVDEDYTTATVYVNDLNDPTEITGDGVIVVESDGSKNILIRLQDVVKPLQQVSILDDIFITESGEEWKMRYGSNFMLCQLVAEGVDISDRLYPNLNGFRLTGMYSNISQQVGFKPFHPKNYPNWLNSISDTFDILNSKGYYAKLDLFCDLQLMSYSLDELKKILNGVVDMLRSKKNGFGHSLGNENEANGFNADDFTKPSIPFATGSGLTGGPAPLCKGVPWDYQYQHLRRDEKMFIDIPPVDAPSYWMQHKLLFDETIGYWDQENTTSSRTGNVNWAYKMGRVMSAWNGGVIHLHHGIHSEVMPAHEQACIDAFSEGFE